MSGFVPVVSASATGAVAAHHQLMMAEEERMTKYTREEIEQDWEFKIVRASLGDFGKPAALQKLLQEESIAGWTMVEKFDDNRVRFKRPRSAREQDAFLPQGVNPYRTQYGRPAVLYAGVFIGIVLLIVFVLAFVVLSAG